MFNTYYSQPDGYTIRGYLLPNGNVEIFEEFGNESQTVGVFHPSRVSNVVIALTTENLEF